jgi:hypothetical protein
MPTITKILLKRIATMLTERPLQDGEYRRIPHMGSHYISRESTYQDQKPFLTTEIEGESYNIFRSISE